MLHLIPRYLLPRPLHRAGYRLAHALRRQWWRLRKPRLAGCRVVALDPADRVLLIRHSYGSGKWMPPGGGIGRGEAPAAAAARELHEETACTLEEPAEIARLHELLHGAHNVVHIVSGRTCGEPRCDGREVVEARFFDPRALPEAMPRYLRDQLPGWITTAIAARPADPARSRSRPPAPTG